MSVKKMTGIALATAAAAAFATAPMTHVIADEAGVNCYGINSCKGQGSCNTPTSKCKGENSCKGKGVLVVPSAEECVKKGGAVMK